MSSAGQIIGYAEALLRVDGAESGVPGLEETQMLSFCDQANREYCNAFKNGGGEYPDFLKKDHGFDIIADTTLAADSAAGATSITLEDSSGFPASGVIAVWDEGMPDLATFTGNAADVLSGVSGLSHAHEEGDTVQVLYALPDFDSFRSTHRTQQGILVNNAPYRFTSDFPFLNEFSTFKSGATTYLWLPRSLSGQVYMTYNARPTTIDDADDELNIPVDDEYFAVWRIVEMGREILLSDGISVQNARNRADKLLYNALRRRNTTKIVRTAVRPRVFANRPPSYLYQTRE